MVRIGLLFLFIAVSQGVSAHDVASSTTEELRSLREEVSLLRRDIARLEELILLGQADDFTRHGHRKSRGIWGCFMDDISAGGVYGTGTTEAEAKGKAMQDCKSKGGSCWENKLVCSKE